MKGFVAATDYDWYTFLSQHPELPEVNFWQPSGGQDFHALAPGEPLFFKLKKPHYAIAGFGFFARHTRVPAWLAWDTFGMANGAPDFVTMRRRIEHYRRVPVSGESASYEIGCLLLSTPIFFPPERWIPQPEDWKHQVVRGAGYPLASGEGKRIWDDCRAAASLVAPVLGPTPAAAEDAARYGAPILVEPRLGQGIFRIGVMDAYGRACAITSEHSLPALDAAHIRPYNEGGTHSTTNGVLLRSDFHRLFDKGYLTITPDYHIEVSGRLREDYQNGHSYYPFHGKVIRPPQSPADRPDPQLLRWHNENVFAAGR
jgi:putative restriction endonuclease